MSIQEVKFYVGVDVASGHLDLFFPDTCKSERIKNTPAALDSLCKRMEGKTEYMVISKFASVLKPIPVASQSDEERKHSALVTRRSQLVDLITQEKNRLKQTWDEDAKKSIQKMLKHLGNELESISTDSGLIEREELAPRAPLILVCLLVLVLLSVLDAAERFLECGCRWAMSR